MKSDITIITDNLGNIKPHLDIEKDIQNKRDGLFTFNLRVSQGKIEDYASYRTVTYEETIIKSLGTTATSESGTNSPEEKPRDAHIDSTGNSGNAIRPNNR